MRFVKNIHTVPLGLELETNVYSYIHGVLQNLKGLTIAVQQVIVVAIDLS